MASTKISALTAATTLTGSESIPVVQGGVTKKVTTDQFLTKDASGNVGVGTASPSAKLEVVGGFRQKAVAGNANGFNITIDSGTDAVTLSNYYNAPLIFGQNNSEIARFSAGNLGLGVAPSAWTLKALDVSNSGSFYGDGAVWSWVAGVSQNAYYDGTWKYRHAGHTAERYEIGAGHNWYIAPTGLTAGAAISFGTAVMTLDVNGRLGIGTANPAVILHASTSGNTPFISESTGSASSYLQLKNTGGMAYVASYNDALFFATGSSATERARIDASGNLLVGTTSSAGSGVKFATHSAHATGAVAELYASNGAYGGNALMIYADRTTTDGSFNVINYYNAGAGDTRFAVKDSGNVVNTNNSYGAISDLKLKENITDASPKLAKLMQVRIVNYTLKSDPDKTKLIGVVAQELAQVSPGLIEETADFEDVKKTREVTKSVPVTEQVTVQREQKTVEVVDGKAVVIVTLVDEQTAVPVVDKYPLFDADGQPVLEVDTPEVPEVLDEDGNVTQPAVPATYRQALHSVPRMQDVTETEEYIERVPLGTTTKSVKYSIFVPMLVKAVQEQQGQIEAQQAQIDAQNEAMQLLANRLAALEAA